LVLNQRNWDHQASILCNIAFLNPNNRNNNFLTILAVEGPYIKLLEPDKQSSWSRRKAICILAIYTTIFGASLGQRSKKN